jgi:hypothetical protein
VVIDKVNFLLLIKNKALKSSTAEKICIFLNLISKVGNNSVDYHLFFVFVPNNLGKGIRKVLLKNDTKILTRSLMYDVLI